MATQVVCPSCAATVDCSGPTAEVIEKANKVKSIKTTLSLGALAKIDRASFTLIRLMKCADPDPEEPSDWIEYLLCNPQKGFIWLLQQRDQRALAFQAVPEAVRLHLARGSAAGRVQLARQGGRHDQDHRLQGRHAETDARTG
ncbi:hypothetical protein G6F31_018559 [Rhizopus arrhizus]|nr:hypothetical protein G6F31_018559 [Rhizopus arrhizus]